MTRAVVTGNLAAGHALVAAGEANRSARGCCGGAYPITPQTETIEHVMGASFSKGSFVTVESEHSAMAVCIGTALAGARSFTASSSNGLLYMAENVFAAGLARLPIVMVVSNRTIGPPWNIWADHGDSLALRDAPWLQLYCDSHQDLVDTILVAFRVAEDPRVLLPVMVTQDGFLLSHTSMVVDLPPQDLIDAYLPPLDLALRTRTDRPRTYGQMMGPRETQRHHEEIQAAMERVPEVLDEATAEFARVFGRRPRGSLETEHVADADTVLIAAGTTVSTLRRVVDAPAAPAERSGSWRSSSSGRSSETRSLTRSAPPGVWPCSIATIRRVRVGSCGTRSQPACGSAPDVLLQGYVVGLGGGEVDPPLIELVLDDLAGRARSQAPHLLPATGRLTMATSLPEPGTRPRPRLLRPDSTELPRLRHVGGPAVARRGAGRGDTDARRAGLLRRRHARGLPRQRLRRAGRRDHLRQRRRRGDRHRPCAPAEGEAEPTICWAGDGGTYDIGLATLSGAPSATRCCTSATTTRSTATPAASAAAGHAARRQDEHDADAARTEAQESTS